MAEQPPAPGLASSSGPPIGLDAVTLVVPTRNRPRAIRRLLDYYARYAPGLALVVTDSSAEGDPAPDQARGARVVFMRRPAEGFASRLREAFARVETPFTVLSPDDYLIVPEAIETCCSFLHVHPDFSAVEGASLAWTSLFGRNVFTSYARQGLDFHAETTTATARLDHLLNPDRYYGLFYACQRTEAARRHWSLLAGADLSSAYLVEYAAVALSMISGKATTLPTLYALISGFVLHEPSAHTSIHWIVEKQSAEFGRAVDLLAGELSAADGVPFEACRGRILEFFDRFSPVALARQSASATGRWSALATRMLEKPFYATGREDLLARLRMFRDAGLDLLVGPSRARRLLKERGLSLDDPEIASALARMARHFRKA